MDYLAFCGLIAFLSGLPAAIIIFVNRPRTMVKLIWSSFGVGITLWGLSFFFFFTSRDADSALFWGRYINYFALPIPLFLMHFYPLLAGTWHKYRWWLITWSVIIVVYIGYCLLNPQQFIPSVRPYEGLLFYPVAGSLYYFFIFYYSVTVLSSLLMLANEFKRVSTLTRNQYTFIIIFSLIGFVGGASMMYYLFDIPIFPFGAIGIPIFNLGMVYVIVKHQLIDLRVVFSRGLKYTLAVSLLMFVYLIFVWAVERAFAQIIGYHGWVGSLTVVIIIGLIVIPFRHILQRLIDKILFSRSLTQLIDEHDLMRQQLMRQQRYQMLSEFSKKITQQWRDPLTTLSAYSYHLKTRLNDEVFLRKFAEVYEREVNVLKQLLDQLGEFADPGALDLKPLDIRSVCLEVSESVQDQCHQGKIKFYQHIPTKPCQISGDITHLKQAIYYFLRWSINSTPAGGQIWMTLEYKPETIEIGIKDTGRGLTNKERMSIFDPAMSSQNDHMTQVARGQVIIAQHSGQVIIDAQENIGTEWVIQLPRYHQSCIGNLNQKY